MTEHSKISVAKAEPVETGASLFERASGTFGLDAFKPAAPPKNLPEARPARGALPQVTAPEKLAPMPVPEAPSQVPPPAAQAPSVEPVRAAEAKERVEFNGATHSVDRDLMARNGLILPDGPVSSLLEEFRIVKRELLGDAREAGTVAARRILVCSPHPGEGKTYCATNLAIAMAAERDIEVLLVDADFAKPSIPGLLGIDAGKGFMDCLADPALAPESLVLRTDIEGLFLLPAGNRTTRDAEYLASARTGQVLDRLTQGANNRILVFDTPPALAASPAADLAKHVGQALLVARADVTGQSALEDAAQLLSACPDIKLLLNATYFSPSGRSFGSYEGYGSE